MTQRISLVLLFFLLLLSACRKDDITETNGSGPNGPTVQVEANVVGIVQDANNGTILQDARVWIDDEVYPTDNNGYFSAQNVILKQTGSLIKVDYDNYISAYMFVIPAAGKTHFVKIALVREKSQGTFTGDSEAVVTLGSDGLQITLPANGISRDGEPYGGAYQVFAHWYNPNDPQFVSTMPGDLRGEDSDGEQVQLESYGMVSVDLRTLSGQALNIAEGATAELSFPVPDGYVDLPESMPLWSLDEESGIWIEESTATLDGDRYIGEVSHFSFWNCDYPYPLVELEGRLVGTDGNPIPFQNIYLTIVDGGGVASGRTDEEGYFAGKVPQDQIMEMNIFNECGFIGLDQEIGPFATDTDLGDVTLDLNDAGIATVSGVLLQCDGSGADNGYVTVSTGDTLFQIIPVANNGQIQGSITLCNDRELDFHGVDLEFLQESEFTTLFVEQGQHHELGELVACQELNEFYLSTFEGVTTPASQFFLRRTGDRYELSVRMFEDSGDRLIFDTDASSPTSAIILFAADILNDCSGSFCQSVELNILNYPTEIGEYMEGTVSGTIEEVPIDISFKVALDEIWVPITGKMWLDENENGVQDAGEPPVTNVGIFAQDKISNAIRPGEVNEDGEYFLSIPEGVSHDLVLQILAQYDMTQQDVGGDDTVDSDFNQFAQITGVVATEALVYDAGFIASNNFSCDINITPQYCVETGGCIEISLSEEFSLEVNGQIEGNFQGYANLCNLAPGSYDIRVELLSTGQICEELVTISDEPINIQLENSELYCVAGEVNMVFEVSINGGVFPFGPLWYDESWTIIESGPFLDEVGPGTYYFVAEFEDCRDTATFIVPETSIRITGKVWDDNTGSIPNVGELGEAGIQGVTVAIYDADGVFIKETSTDSSGEYVFNGTGLADAPFQIKIESPSGFELVDEGVMGDPDMQEVSSDADADTGFTSLISPDACDRISLNFGLK